MCTTPEEKLFSKINHDLRGSFVSILGYSGILTDSNEEVTESEVKEFVSRIDFRTKETFELLESFTNWLKLEQYSQSNSDEEVNLFESVSNIQSLFAQDFFKRNIETKIEIDKSIFVLFDAEIIRSLLKNIFLFIKKYSVEKSELKISTFTSKKNTDLRFRFNLSLSEKEILPLTNLKENIIEYSNVPNEILFSKKFIELCGGTYNLEISDKKNITIILTF